MRKMRFFAASFLKSRLQVCVFCPKAQKRGYLFIVSLNTLHLFAAFLNIPQLILDSQYQIFAGKNKNIHTPSIVPVDFS